MADSSIAAGFGQVRLVLIVMLHRIKRYKTISCGIIVASALFFIECASIKGKDSDPNELENVGDRTSHSFREMLISIPIADSRNGYENLHLVITASINTKEDSMFSSTFSALNVVEKLEAKVASEILKVTETKEPIKWGEVYRLKPAILAAVKKVFDNEYGKWKHRNRFTVDFAITVFYLSNSLEQREYGVRDFYAK